MARRRGIWPGGRRVVAAAACVVAALGLAAVPVVADPVPPAVPAPSMDTPAAVTETSANLEGELGLTSLPVLFHFEYGTTTAYGTSAPLPDQEADLPPSCTSSSPNDYASPEYNITLSCPIAASIAGHVVIPVQGLTPGTTYHVQLIAHDSLGSATSADATFTTAGSAPVPDSGSPPAAGNAPAPPAVAPRPAILTRGATLDRTHHVTIVVACRGTTGRCDGTLALMVTDHRRPRTLARALVLLRAGAHEHVKLQVDTSGVRMLARARHAQLATRATFDGASSTFTLERATGRPGRTGRQR